MKITLPTTGSGLRQTNTSRSRMSFRIAFLLLVGLLAAKVSFGQTYFAPLYSETFGTPASNLNIWGTSQYTGFLNYLGVSNPSANYFQVANHTNTVPPTARTTAASTTYSIPAILNNGVAGTPSASGNGFCPGSTTLVSGFGIQNINTSGVALADELWLGFGAVKSNGTTSNPSVDWSADGTAWNSVSVTFVNTTVWTYYTFQLPNAAKTSNLRLRFNNAAATGSPQTRFDDIRVAAFTPAVAGTPTLVTSFTGLNKFFATTTQNSASGVFTVAGTDLTADITGGPVTGFEFAASAGGPWTTTFSRSPVSNTVATSNVFIRATSGAVGATSGTLTVTTPGATNSTITLHKEVYSFTASSFGANNLLVAQMGDENFNQTGVSTPVFLTEITKTGTFVKKVPVPFFANGGNLPLTVSGGSTTSATLNLSPDKKYLTVVGYEAPINTATAVANDVTTYKKVIARFENSGAVDATTTINDAFQTGDIRSAVTTDGSKFWASGVSNAVSSVRFATLGSTGASVGLDDNITNSRYINITNSQVYVGSQSGAFVGLNRVGTGLPEVNASGSVSLILSESNTYGFVFADQSTSVAGTDVVYIANGTNGLFKYSFDGSTWTARGSITGTPVFNVYAEDNGSDVDVYFTTADRLYVINDASAQASNITGNGTLISSLTPIYTAPTGTFLRGISSTPQVVITPSINHTFVTPSTTVAQGGTNQQLYRIQLDVTVGAATLSGVTLTTNGTYTGPAITSFKLIRSADATLDGGDTQFSTINTSTGSGQILNFSTSESFALGTWYVFVVADVAGCATVGNTIGINAIALSNLTYNDGTKTETAPAAASSYTIQAGTPSNVTGLAITTGSSTLPITWTNPACFDAVLVVADVNPITTIPTANSYLFNNSYTGSGDSFGATGKVVYQGTGNSFTLSGLNIGSTYYVKVFTRINPNTYSSGVQSSATVTITTYYSQLSGDHSAPIWALTPSGTPTTAVFNSNNNFVIQNGHSVNLLTSAVNMRDITVNAGGTFTTTTLAASPRYLLVHGTLVNNGTFGGPTLGMGFSPESQNVRIIANQPVYISRINKRTAVTGTVNIFGNVFLTFNGASIGNNLASIMNVVINPGARVINIGGPLANVSIDANAGAGTGDRAGTITVNGILDAGAIYYGFNNNTTATATTPTIIGATGTLIADSILFDQTAVVGTKADASLTITPGGKLQVRKHITVATGNIPNGLELLTSNNRTARLTALGVGQTVGNIRYERAIPTVGWHFFTAPVQGATFNTISGLGFRLLPKNNANLFKFDENDTTSFRLGTVYYERNGWKVASALTDNLNGDLGFGLGPQISGYRYYNNTVGRTYSITGAPFVGNLTRRLTFSPATGWDGGGWNLVANPYPSELDWNTVMTANGGGTGALSSTYYVYNAALGSYATYSPSLGGTNGASRYVANGQGIFAKVTAQYDLLLRENQKATVGIGAGTFLRTTSTPNVMRIKLDGANRTDESILAFLDDATLGYDNQYDAYKMDGTFLNVSTKPTSALNFAVNAMPMLTAATVIPVRVSVATAGTYTLRFEDVNSMDANIVVYLRDNVRGTLTDLTQTDRYTFDLVSGALSTSTRFEIVAGPAAVTSANKGLLTTVAVAPNPSQGSFVVTATGLKGSTASVEVISVDGRKVYTSTTAITNGVATQPIALKATAGVYTVRIIAAGQANVTKLVIE